jgi:hypothetical protein
MFLLKIISRLVLENSEMGKLLKFQVFQRDTTVNHVEILPKLEQKKTPDLNKFDITSFSEISTFPIIQSC